MNNLFSTNQLKVLKIEIQSLFNYLEVDNLVREILTVNSLKKDIAKISKQGVLQIQIDSAKLVDALFFPILVLKNVYQVCLPNQSYSLLKDIEVDLEIFSIHFSNNKNQQNQIDFQEYLKLLYHALFTDKDYRIRKEKFNRYFGSLLSIYNYTQTGVKKIFYPHTDNTNDDNIYFAVIAEGRNFSKCNLSETVILQLIKMYHDTNKFTLEEFTDLHESTFFNITQQLNAN